MGEGSMKEEFVHRVENKGDLYVFLDKLFPGLHEKHIFTGRDLQKRRIALTLPDSPERRLVEQEMTVAAMSLRSTALSFLEVVSYEAAQLECIPELVDSYFLKYTLLSLARMYFGMVREDDSVVPDVALKSIDDVHTNSRIDIDEILSNEYKNEEFNNLLIFMNTFYSRVIKGLGGKVPRSNTNRAIVYDTSNKTVYPYDRNYERTLGTFTDKDDFANRSALMPGIFTLLYAKSIEAVPTSLITTEGSKKIALAYPLSAEKFEGVKPEVITLQHATDTEVRRVHMVRRFPVNTSGIGKPVVNIYYSFGHK